MAQHFHILGIGSIGQLLAHNLRSAGQAVTLLARSASKAESFAAAGHKLTLERGPGSFSTTNAGMELVQASTGAHKDIRNLVVSTKGNDVVTAVRSVRGRLQADSSIILIQNGILGVYKTLWHDLLSTWDSSSRPRVIVGSLTHGAYLAGPFHVFHASPGSGTCTFAEVDAGLPCLTDARHQHMWAERRDQTALQTLLSLKPLQPEQAASHQALLRLLQLKLACNCAINPLTAILGCLNGDLLQCPSTKDTMRAVCTEVHNILGVGSAASASLEEMYETVCRVAAGTAENRSSMLQDMQAGRPSELPFLNGYVVQQGQESQIPVPTNQVLCQLVSFLEGRKLGGK